MVEVTGESFLLYKYNLKEMGDIISKFYNKSCKIIYYNYVEIATNHVFPFVYFKNDIEKGSFTNICIHGKDLPADININGAIGYTSKEKHAKSISKKYKITSNIVFENSAEFYKFIAETKSLKLIPDKNSDYIISTTTYKSKISLVNYMGGIRSEIDRIITDSPWNTVPVKDIKFDDKNITIDHRKFPITLIPLKNILSIDIIYYMIEYDFNMYNIVGFEQVFDKFKVIGSYVL